MYIHVVDVLMHNIALLALYSLVPRLHCYMCILVTAYDLCISHIRLCTREVQRSYTIIDSQHTEHMLTLIIHITLGLSLTFTITYAQRTLEFKARDARCLH